MTVSSTANATVCEEPSARDHSNPPDLAVDETATLLHPPLPLVSVSIVMERERRQNDSLVNGYPDPRRPPPLVDRLGW